MGDCDFFFPSQVHNSSPLPLCMTAMKSIFDCLKNIASISLDAIGTIALHSLSLRSTSCFRDEGVLAYHCSERAKRVEPLPVVTKDRVGLISRRIQRTSSSRTTSTRTLKPTHIPPLPSPSSRSCTSSTRCPSNADGSAHDGNPFRHIRCCDAIAATTVSVIHSNAQQSTVLDPSDLRARGIPPM